MPKFKVEIRETLIKTVLVEAEDRSDAEEKAEAAYNNEKFVLDYRDFDEAEFRGEEIDPSEFEELAELNGLDIIEEAAEFAEEAKKA